MTEHQLLGRQVGELISAEIDDALSLAEAEALDAHLRTCDACRALRASLRGAQQRLRAGMPRPTELERARRYSLARIRSAANRRSWLAGLPRGLSVVTAALLLVVAAIAWPRTPAANPSVPEREVVATRSSELSWGTVTLTVEQGSAAARPGDNVGVLSRAEIRFRAPATGGSVEIRAREPGDAYGILATSRSIAGATLLRLEGPLPALDRGQVRTYELWVHLELNGTPTDTQPIVLQVEGVAGGTRARLP